jgi:hypothetical protein
LLPGITPSYSVCFAIGGWVIEIEELSSPSLTFPAVVVGLLSLAILTMSTLTPIKSRRVGNSKRTRHAHISRMSKVDEGDESQCSNDNHPDQVSTSGSENSDGSTNSQPPLLDFIGTACMASTWFTSCFPCAVVDINHCDDNVVNKLNRTNAMSVMYGIHEEQNSYTVQAPVNSFDLRPGEKEEEEVSHPEVDDRPQTDESDMDKEVDQLAAELEEEEGGPAPPNEPHEAVHEDTPISSPTRKRFMIPRRPASVRKLFKRRQQQ